MNLLDLFGPESELAGLDLSLYLEPGLDLGLDFDLTGLDLGPFAVLRLSS